MDRKRVTIDGNEAAAYVAHRLSDVIAIYPITPSSPMGEWADQWSSEGQPNIWGAVPNVTEMQSEAGAAAVLHGALQTGSLATTFTASQGLLLMIPNMFKIAGELTPAVIHVSARTIATHALSIFGDQGDVMAARSTGFAMLASGSVQEVMDQALIAHAATLEARVPFIHFFDGFRTSHEVMKVEQLTNDDLRAMIDDEWVRAHRSRGLNPDRPVLRGSSQNPDVFFQAREATNPFYSKCPDIVQGAMDRFAALTGRQYHLFDYTGDPHADRVIVMMGSGAETAHEAVEHLVARGERVGLLKVRLYRPFDGRRFVEALPASVKKLAVLDRTKEPGSAGEPLYQDILTALVEFATESGRFHTLPKVLGGRYGLSSKEFTPAMVKGVFDELAKPAAKNHFTIGIEDDVSHTSLDYDPHFVTEDPDSIRALFFGLGADGTVGANKNSIKIIGEGTDNYAQGYFVYDSKKSGAVTVSHLRFGPRPIRSTYLVQQANFVACHQPNFLDRHEMLAHAAPGATFLLNTEAPRAKVWQSLPHEVREQIIHKRLRMFAIDAYAVAKQSGMGGRINTVMQTCFFAISGVLPRDEAIAKIKEAIHKSYKSKGEAIVAKNCAAVDRTLENLYEVEVSRQSDNGRFRIPIVPDEAPEFVRTMTARILAGDGDLLPVSAMPVDGTFPTGTAKWEKRNLAQEIPVWNEEICIQCNKCALVCPHAAIRPNVVPAEALRDAPANFKFVDARGADFKGLKYALQVAPEDCTGCTLCVEICPSKDRHDPNQRAINMAPQAPIREQEKRNFDYFLKLPAYDRGSLKTGTVKGSQFLIPLFEFSGGCTGCGETPYVKLLSQLFGDRAVIANATGCSSIFGGNLPTTPWTVNAGGQGPAWCNSLFEDAAEFGLGFRVSIDQQTGFARQLLTKLRGGGQSCTLSNDRGGRSSTLPSLDPDFVDSILDADQSTESGIAAQRERIVELRERLVELGCKDSYDLHNIADSLVRRSVWIVGGDGWAYDIGYGGLDHVLASGKNVNVLVLDTEVYSNTGGQASKSTPIGAVARFASTGKTTAKKDLGMRAVDYGNVYVATVAMGANDNQTVQAFADAESYDGPSIIIAYAHCIAHGIEMSAGLRHQQAAVDSGHWTLYRFDPRRADKGLNPMQLDSREPKHQLREYAETENRFQVLRDKDPARAEELLKIGQEAATRRYKDYARRAEPWPKPAGG